MVNCSSRHAQQWRQINTHNSRAVCGRRERASSRARSRTHLLNNLIETDFFLLSRNCRCHRCRCRRRRHRRRHRRRREHFVFARSDLVCRLSKN